MMRTALYSQKLKSRSVLLRSSTNPQIIGISKANEGASFAYWHVAAMLTLKSAHVVRIDLLDDGTK